MGALLAGPATPYGRELAETGAAEIGRRVSELAERLAPAQRATLTELAAALVRA